MANKNNATCSICGNGYYMCLSCNDKVNSWKIYTDTAEHYKVFQVVRGFSNNVYTKDEAREKIKNINLIDLESFRPHIKEIVKNILKEDKQIVEVENKAEEHIETEATTIEDDIAVKNVIIEKNESNIKTANSRRRKFNVEAE
jgi:pyruvate/2-oxoacid:ferredoxin oxidoreductase alpha subunit